MNTILQGPCRIPFFTDIRLVLEAFAGRQNEFNWLITDLEYANLDGAEMPPEFILRTGFEPLQFRGPIWLSGKRLSEAIEGRRIQFVWAVLSGFHPNVEIDPTNLEVHPFADGNPGFWKPIVAIQHPRAMVEIVCWDNTLTLLLSKDDDLTRRFREFFPESLDLDIDNQRRWAVEREVS